MTDYKFGDVILVPFPFTDQSTSKKRPAVIVSSTLYNQRRPDVVIMAVTSQIHGSGYFGDIRIQKWQQAGLLKASVIKPILTTVEKGLIIKKLGCLADNDQEALNKGLQTIIG
ncbi:type II toxin-antitoxin system PemK/MazF family toxin [Desulfobacter postgatei]|uniref:type II toxin-antitoxin system PemK/MazF family toxin n=1 Tax=Desulfobacter postgatei TaxID=2293 RepID=UPI00259BDD24|nr:type II toxin-antitoxin system PemK/MazF family toxin [uncultured Desulfobacter sp.]